MDVAFSQGGPSPDIEYHQIPLYLNHLKKGVCSDDLKLTKQEAERQLEELENARHLRSENQEPKTKDVVVYMSEKEIVENREKHHWLLKGESSYAPPVDGSEIICTDPPNEDQFWILKFDGSKSKLGSGARVELQSPKGKRYEASFRLQFPCTCNSTEYEALVLKLKLALQNGVKYLKIIGDSELVVNQIQNVYSCKDPRLYRYQTRVWDLLRDLESFKIQAIS